MPFVNNMNLMKYIVYYPVRWNTILFIRNITNATGGKNFQVQKGKRLEIPGMFLSTSY